MPGRHASTSAAIHGNKCDIGGLRQKFHSLAFPSLQTVGVVVCHMPLVGALVVPLSPTQYLLAPNAEPAKAIMAPAKMNIFLAVGLRLVTAGARRFLL